MYLNSAVLLVFVVLVFTLIRRKYFKSLFKAFIDEDIIIPAAKKIHLDWITHCTGEAGLTNIIGGQFVSPYCKSKIYKFVNNEFHLIPLTLTFNEINILNTRKTSFHSIQGYKMKNLKTLVN